MQVDKVENQTVYHKCRKCGETATEEIMENLVQNAVEEIIEEGTVQV